MTYRFVLACVVALLSLRLTLGGGLFSDEQDLCFSNAFQDAPWMACISPILAQVEGEFDIAAMCMSGENEALHCLFSKIDECYDFLAGILSSTRLTQEQAAVMDFTTIWNNEIVNILCEVYEGRCDAVPACQIATVNYLEGNVPLLDAVQTVVGLCGPKCFFDYNATCPSIIKFYRAVAFASFGSFDDARIERTRAFIDEHCTAAADFEIDCVMEKLNSTEMKTCYDGAINDLAAQNNLCRMYNFKKTCIDASVKPACGVASSDLLKEGLMVTLPAALSQSCQDGTGASAGLEVSVSFLLFTVVTLLLSSL